jgi:hypothetical protein
MSLARYLNINHLQTIATDDRLVEFALIEYLKQFVQWNMYQVSFEVMLLSNVQGDKTFEVPFICVRLVPAE